MASSSLAIGFPLLPPHALLFELLISSTVIGFSRQKSLFRPAALPVIAACVYGIVSTSSQHMRPRWASLLGGTSLAFLLQYIDLALLSQWSYETHGPGPEPGSKDSSGKASPSQRWDFESSAAVSVSPPREQATDAARKPSDSQTGTLWKRLRFGWNSMWVFRHVNSKYEVKNVPPFSKTDPEYVPPRWTFVLQRTLVAATCYLTLDLLGSRPAPKNTAVLFNREFIPFFGRLGSVTAAQLKLRALSIGGFAFTFYCVIQGCQSAAAAVAVSLGLSDVESWRPAFGSLSEAYTLRNIWGKFWHQSLRQLLTSPASHLTHNILKLPRGSLLARCIALSLSFGISGIMHSAAGIATGMSVKETGVLQFFCTQAVGVLTEEGVQALYRCFSGQEKDKAPPSVLTRCIGYAWVAAFLTWSGPIWIYPQASRPAPEGPSSFLPYSIVKALRSR